MRYYKNLLQDCRYYNHKCYRTCFESQTKYDFFSRNEITSSFNLKPLVTATETKWSPTVDIWVFNQVSVNLTLQPVTVVQTLYNKLSWGFFRNGKIEFDTMTPMKNPGTVSKIILVSPGWGEDRIIYLMLLKSGKLFYCVDDDIRWIKQDVVQVCRKHDNPESYSIVCDDGSIYWYDSTRYAEAHKDLTKYKTTPTMFLPGGLYIGQRRDRIYLNQESPTSKIEDYVNLPEGECIKNVKTCGGKNNRLMFLTEKGNLYQYIFCDMKFVPMIIYVGGEEPIKISEIYGDLSFKNYITTNPLFREVFRFKTVEGVYYKEDLDNLEQDQNFIQIDHKTFLKEFTGDMGKLNFYRK
jgi:hypothetical protein